MDPRISGLLYSRVDTPSRVVWRTIGSCAQAPDFSSATADCSIFVRKHLTHRSIHPGTPRCSGRHRDIAPGYSILRFRRQKEPVTIGTLIPCLSSVFPPEATTESEMLRAKLLAVIDVGDRVGEAVDTSGSINI